MIIGGALAAIVAVAVIVGLLAGGSDDSTATTESTTTTEASVDTVVIDPVETPTTSVVTVDGPDEIELPAAVARIQAPTEVVVLAQGGLLHTLSLPSGRIRTVDLNGVADTPARNVLGGSVVVAADATAVGVGPSELIIIPRSGEAIDVEMDLGVGSGGANVDGWVRSDDGSTRFLVTVYPTQGGIFELFTVTADGAIAEVPGGAARYGMGPAAGFDGDVVVNDAGGAYRVAGDGTYGRIEDGMVYASNGGHRLVRECDERLQCVTVLVSESDGARRVIDPAVLPQDFQTQTFNLALSPDGSAAAMTRSGSEQQRVIVDLATGEVAAARSDMWTGGSTWAADSSGVFDVVNGGLQFIDRSTGEAVRFGQEFGAIMSVGVRRPDAELPVEPAIVTAALTPQRPIGRTGLVVSAAVRTGGIGSLSVDDLELTTWESPPLGRASAVLASPGNAVVALPGDGVEAFISTPDATTMLGEQFTADAPMLPGPSGTIWVPDDTDRATDVRYRLLRLDGTVADDLGDPLVDVSDAMLLGSDGRGALVVERRGDVFVVGVDGATRLTSGELVAIGATTAYVRECDTVVDCTIVRIDRQSAERSEVDLAAPLTDSLGAVDGARSGALGSTVSPDGNVIVSQLDAVRGGLEPVLQTVLLDVATGAVTFVDGRSDDQPIVWNDDSTFAALLVGSIVHVYDRAADDVVELDGPRIRAIGPAPGDG